MRPRWNPVVLSLLCVGLIGCPSKPQVLVSMDGATITASDVKNAVPIYGALLNPNSANPERYKAILEVLISQKVTLLAAKEAGFKVDTTKYFFSLDDASKSALDQFNAKLANQLAVTDEEIQNYYKHYSKDLVHWPQFLNSPTPPSLEVSKPVIKLYIAGKKRSEWLQRERDHFHVTTQ